MPPTWIAAREAIVDGEVIALDDRGEPDFALLQARIKGQGQLGTPTPFVYEVFDLLWLDGRSLLDEPLETRRRLLAEALRPDPRVRLSEHITGDGIAFFEAARVRGLEGIMAKDRRSPYVPGARSMAWQKVKIRPEQELVVGGMTRGTGKAVELGALARRRVRGRRPALRGQDRCRVQRPDPRRAAGGPGALVVDASAFAEPPPRAVSRSAIWVRPESSSAPSSRAGPATGSCGRRPTRVSTSARILARSAASSPHGEPGGLGGHRERRGPTRPIRDVVAVPLGRVLAHLVLEPQPSLIDCGYARSRGRIERAMSEHGHALAELARVVCTHGHPDHAGGARELALAGIPVLIHPADGERLAITWRDMLRRPTRGKFFAAMTPEPPQTVPIEDGDVLPMLGGLRVIHTPGHTPGSVCFYGARDRVVFVGDTLQRRFGRVSFASSLYSDDIGLARRAVQRLASLDVETVVFSHYPPLTEGASETLASLARRLD